MTVLQILPNINVAGNAVHHLHQTVTQKLSSVRAFLRFAVMQTATGIPSYVLVKMHRTISRLILQTK